MDELWRRGTDMAKKKSKLLILFLMLCFMILAVYGGIWSGAYFAQKLAKPVEENKNALEGAESGGETGKDYVLSEDDKIHLTAITTEFIAAEHLKKTDKLTSLVDNDYYNTLLKNMKSLTTLEVTTKDIDFQYISKDSVKIKVTFLKDSKNYSEVLTLKLYDKSWKVSGVDR